MHRASQIAFWNSIAIYAPWRRRRREKRQAPWLNENEKWVPGIREFSQNKKNKEQNEGAI